MANPEYANVGREVAPPKEDTLSMILGRIESLITGSGLKNESRLESVKDRICGAVPEPIGTGKSAGELSSHVIFTASRIEQMLDAHFGRISGTISQLERVV